ncbi:hypothetical protein M3Y98_00386300 [Aphelenchoides besseyi]|nr:hypothetical protein M3Y98_00386300 [Aphelenchoides besseyi]
MSWTSVEYEASTHTSQDIYDEDYFVNSTDLNDVEIHLALRAAYQSDPEVFRTLIAILVITTAFLGLVTNAFTMYISINIQGDYRHFIANLAVVDIVCALLYMFMGYVNLDRSHISTTSMAWHLYLFFVRSPAFLFLSSALLLVQPITHENVIVTTQLCLATSPLFDALISLFVIKQYRITTARFCSRFFHVDCCILPRQKSSMIVEQHALTSFYSPIPTVRVATD